MPRSRFEGVITRIIQATGYSTILFVLMILFFLLREGLPALAENKLSALFSTRWYPIESYYGIVPLILGSLVVTLCAILVALPFGVGTAVYISEIAPRIAKEVLKPLIEILAGLPSVVLGFLGILVLSPMLRRLLNLPTGLTAFTGALLLGGIAIPTIVSVAEDALNTVPKSYREASLALGATPWQTIWGVTVPAARLGYPYRRHAGGGARHGRDDDGDDGDRKRPGDAAFAASPVYAGAHHDGDHRFGNGRGSRWQPPLPCAVLHWIDLFLFSLAVNFTTSWFGYRRQKRSEQLLS